MSHKRNPLLLGFISNGEVLLTRQALVHLHKIRPMLLGHVDSLASLLFCAHGNRSRPIARWPIDDRTGNPHARAEQLPGFDLLSPLVVVGEAPHDANPGYTIGDE